MCERTEVEVADLGDARAERRERVVALAARELASRTELRLSSGHVVEGGDPPDRRERRRARRPANARPDHERELGLVVGTGLVVAATTIASPGPISADVNFAKTIGMLGISAPVSAA